MATTHNTATVKIRLDLGELITQLRNLADTLETTHKPKTDPQGLPPEYDGETFAPEDIECTHEAWDVHPNGLRCTRCDDPWHPSTICTACGCDHRRADHGADPR